MKSPPCRKTGKFYYRSYLNSEGWDTPVIELILSPRKSIGNSQEAI